MTAFNGFNMKQIDELATQVGYRGPVEGFAGYLNQNQKAMQHVAKAQNGAVRAARGGLIGSNDNTKPKFVEGGVVASREDQIAELYRTQLGREPDAAGLADQVASGATIESLQSQFANIAAQPGYTPYEVTNGTVSPADQASAQGTVDAAAANPIQTAAPAVQTNQEVFVDSNNPVGDGVGVDSGTPIDDGTTPPVTDPNATAPGITTTMETLAANPAHLVNDANGTQLNSQDIVANDNEMVSTDGSLLTGENATAAPSTAGTAQATDPAATAAAQYDATQILDQFDDPANQAVAAQGELSDESTVAGQLDSLSAEFDEGKVPRWAQGATDAAKMMMGDKGMGFGDSPMAGAIAGAAMSAMLPIATADAAANLTMDMQNLNNKQQAVMFNAQVRTNAIMSDQAADNAAKNFNASSQQQNDQFFASLTAQVSQFNADQTNAIGKFNSGEINDASEFSAKLQNNRDQFNASQQLAINQSNATWRRQINTANTAGDNAANMTNVQNRYNMSSTALNNLWQEQRDGAYWNFLSGENAETRTFNLAMAHLENEWAGDAQDQATKDGIGALVGSIAGKVFTSYAEKNWI